MLYENSDEPYCEELAKAITDEIRRGNRIDTTTKLREIIEKTLDFLPERRKGDSQEDLSACFPGAPDRCKPGIEVLYELWRSFQMRFDRADGQRS